MIWSHHKNFVWQDMGKYEILVSYPSDYACDENGKLVLPTEQTSLEGLKSADYIDGRWKGNAYLYGKFFKNSTVSVKYGDIALAAYTFSGPTTVGKSYALDATVVSLVGKTSDEIRAAE